MAPKLVSRGFLFILFVTHVVRGLGKVHGNLPVGSAEYGWHCYSENSEPGELLTDRAPCLKVTHPVGGYSVIQPYEEYFQFEIDVAPAQTEQPPAPVEIEWFQLQAGQDSSDEGDQIMHQIQGCRNHRVCNARIHRLDERQTLFHFRVSASYRGRDETASEDMVLQVASPENGFVANPARASKVQSSSHSTEVAHQHKMPTTSASTQNSPMHDSEITPRMLDNRGGFQVGSGDQRVGDANTHPAAEHPASTDEHYYDDTPEYSETNKHDLEYDEEDLLQMQLHDSTPEAVDRNLGDHTVPEKPLTGTQLGRRQQRPRIVPDSRPVPQGVSHENLDYDVADNRASKIFPPENSMTDVAYDTNRAIGKQWNSPNLPRAYPPDTRQVPFFEDDVRPNSFYDRDEGTKDRSTEVLLDAINSLSDRVNPAKGTPLTTADHHDLQILSKGLDGVRANVTKILNILTDSTTQSQDQVRGERNGAEINRTTSYAGTEEKDYTRPGYSTRMTENETSSVTSKEHGNDTLLDQLGEIAHGLLNQSCRHLLESYLKLDEHSKAKNNPLVQASKSIDKNMRRGETEDNNNSEGDPPETSKASAYDSAGPTVKANQRRLASFSEDPNIERDFLRMWDAVGLKDDDYMGPRRQSTSVQQELQERKSNGGGRTRSQSGSKDQQTSMRELETVSPDSDSNQRNNSKATEKLDQSAETGVKTELLTILTPEPGVVVRKDLIIVLPTPISDGKSTTPIQSESGEKLQTSSDNAFETVEMMIVTPEPGVLLRKDLVLVHRTPASDDEAATPSPVHFDKKGTTDSSRHLEQITEGKDLQTRVTTILTSTPGVPVGQDLGRIHPTPESLPSENVPLYSASSKKGFLTQTPSQSIKEDHINLKSTKKPNFVLPGFKQIEVPELYLQPFPQPQRKSEYQTTLPPLQIPREDDKMQLPGLSTQPQQENFKMVESTGHTEFPQYAENGGLDTAPDGDLTFATEYDDTAIVDLGLSTVQPTMAMPIGPEFETEYDDTDVFDRGVTTNKPTENITTEMTGYQSEDVLGLPTPRYGKLGTESHIKNNSDAESSIQVDQVYHRLQLSPDVMPSTEPKPHSEKNELHSNDLFKIYESPFAKEEPVPPSVTSSGRQNTQHEDSEEFHIALDQASSHLPDSSPETVIKSGKSADHKMVNFSISGKIEADNRDFLSEILGLLEGKKATSKLIKGLPSLADSRGSNVVIINQEDHGIHIGESALESSKVEHNATSTSKQASQKEARLSQLEKLLSDRHHFNKVPKKLSGMPEVQVHVKDEDGYQVSIQRKVPEESENDGSGGVSHTEKSHFENQRSGNDNEGLHVEEEESENDADFPSSDSEDYGDLEDDSETGPDRDGDILVDKMIARRTRRHPGVSGDREKNHQGGKVLPFKHGVDNIGSDSQFGKINDENDSRATRYGVSYRRQKANTALTNTQIKEPKSVHGDQSATSVRRRRAFDQDVSASSGWSAWGAWSACSVTCGKGELIRQRSCLSEVEPELCTGGSEERAECVVDACLEEEKAKEELKEEGHSTEVECRYDTTQTPQEIYWMSPTGEKITKDSVAFSEKYKITGSKLIVRGVQSKDEGTYHCVVIMGDGSSETADAKINVLTCTSNPCQNGGTCVEHDTDSGLQFTCICPVRFEGHLCQEVSSLFVGDGTMVVLALCILVIVILSVVLWRRNMIKPILMKLGVSPTAVIDMDTVSPEKPLLTDAEIDLFREISKEEFKNFKTSHSYSLFKGKKVSKAEATIDIEEIDKPTAEGDKESIASPPKKPSLISAKESVSASDKESLADQSLKSRRKSSKPIASPEIRGVETPTKKSSSAESVSLPPSPAPAIEKVEQQRSTHVALSSQGQASVEDVVSMAEYQESKPRPGSVASVLSSSVPIPPPTMQQRRSLAEGGKPQSSSSISSGSVTSRSSRSKAKRSLFDASQSQYHTSRHAVTYDEDRKETKDATSIHAVSHPSSQSRMRMESAERLPRLGSASPPGSYTAPLIVKSSSGKLRAVRYEDHSQQRRNTLSGLPGHQDSIIGSDSITFSAEGPGDSQTWIPILGSTTSAHQPIEKPHMPLMSDSHIKDPSLLESSTTSVVSRRQSKIDQESKVQPSTVSMKIKHSVPDTRSSSISGIFHPQPEISKDLLEDVHGSSRQSKIDQETYLTSSTASVKTLPRHSTSNARSSSIFDTQREIMELQLSEDAHGPRRQSKTDEETYLKSPTASVKTLSKHSTSDVRASSKSGVFEAQPEIVKDLSRDAHDSRRESKFDPYTYAKSPTASVKNLPKHFTSDVRSPSTFDTQPEITDLSEDAHDTRRQSMVEHETYLKSSAASFKTVSKHSTSDVKSSSIFGISDALPEMDLSEDAHGPRRQSKIAKEAYLKSPTGSVKNFPRHSAPDTRSPRISGIFDTQSKMIDDMSEDANGPRRQSTIDQETYLKSSTASVKTLPKHSTSDARSSSISGVVDTRSEIIKNLPKEAQGSRRQSRIDQEPLKSPTASVKTLSKQSTSKVRAPSVSGVLGTKSEVIKDLSQEAHDSHRQSKIDQQMQMKPSTTSIKTRSDYSLPDGQPSSCSVTSDKQPEVNKELPEDAVSLERFSPESHILAKKSSGTGSSAISSICEAPLILKSSSGNLRAVVPDVHSQQRRQTLPGSSVSPASSKEQSLASASNLLKAGSVSHASVASSKKSPSAVVKLTNGTDISEEEMAYTTHANQPSKFGFPAYTRRFSLPAGSTPVMDKSEEQLSSDLSRKMQDKNSQNVILEPRESPYHSQQSFETHVSLRPTVSDKLKQVLSSCMDASVDEAVGDLPNKSPSNISAERSRPQLRSEEILRQSASDTSQEQLIAASSYHTAVGTFSDMNTEISQQESSTVRPNSQSRPDVQNTQDVDALTIESSHHWQPLQESGSMDAEIKLKSQSHLIAESTLEPPEKEVTVLASTPAAASAQHLSDWRPLQEYRSAEGDTEDRSTNVKEVSSYDLDQEIPTENPDWQEPSEYGKAESVEIIDSNHPEQGPSSQKRRASKFGYSGYVERFSHLVDSPAVADEEQTAEPPPTTEMPASFSPESSEQSPEEDDEETDLPFDDALDLISEHSED